MCHDTHRRDAASILFNLPGYRVITASRRADGQRVVLIETTAGEDGCPSCGVMSNRVHSRPVQQVRDVSCGGQPVVVRVRKRRYLCAEQVCPRGTFTEVTEELPARARVTTRLAATVAGALRTEPRAVLGVAGEHGLSWTTVMRLATQTLDVDGHADSRLVRRLGIDEHRFRKVRYVRDADTGATVRVEPWSVVFTDLDTGAILDVVDGPRAAAVKSWLRARPRWWRKRVETVAIDMSSEFRSAVREVLPKAKISVDHWHVIRLANQMLTDVRRRRAWEVHGRRGRLIDPPWRYRKLLTCAGDRLSVRQRERLHQILEADIELAVAWGIKEHVRQLMATRDTAAFQRAWAELEKAVRATRLPEPRRLFKTLSAWRRELLTFCRTRTTNARTEAANLTAKTFKRIGRGYRNHDNYRCRIMAYTTSPKAA